MNERIRELYRQAHSIRHYDNDPSLAGNPPTVYWQGEVSAQRFAELIIQDCVGQCEKIASHADLMAKSKFVTDEGRMLHEGMWGGATNCGVWIKKHFGVEE